MTQQLEFRRTKKHGIVPFVDGVSLRRILKKRRDYDGLMSDEALVVARMLQGWGVPPLEYDRSEIVETGPRHFGPDGGYWVAIDVPRVPLTLPGGSEPEVDSADLEVFRDRDGVPVLSCACGGGVGCAAVRVRVKRGAGKVQWKRKKWKATFSEQDHDEAVQQLLILVGESPRLIGSAA